MPGREPTHRVGVHLLLIDKGRVLLIRRKNTKWHDGDYTLVTGHVEKGEKVKDAMAREALEEAGIRISAKDMEIINIINILDEYEAFLLVIKTTKWKGRPSNKEPDYADEIGWFDLKRLPKNTAPYIKIAIHMAKKGIFYSEWRHRYL